MTTPDSARGSPARHVEDNRDSLVETTMELLSYDTQNPPGETAALADLAERRLADLGLGTERLTVEEGKPNVLATLPGERDTTLLYNGHFDTVPFSRGKWTRDPLGEREGDRIYGRGATDMKGQLAAMLAAAEAFAETGTTPPVTLAFLFVSDEETGGDAGLDAVIDREAVDADACVIGEPTCEGNRHSVTVADRGSIWLTLEAAGEGAHGSRPMLGANAIDRLYDAIEEIRSAFGTESLSIPQELRPIVEESVEYYDPVLGAETARDLFASPTVNLGTIEGGESINSVPEQARARLDIRITAGVDTGEILSRIRACADDCPGISIADVSWSVGSYEPIDSPLVEAVAETAADVTGDDIYRRSATGGGDAKTLRHAGIPTVEFGLGTETAHAADEYTTVPALVENALVYTRLPAAFAAGRS